MHPQHPESANSRNPNTVLNKLATNGIPNSVILFFTKVLLKRLQIKVLSQEKLLPLSSTLFIYVDDIILTGSNLQELTNIKEYLNIT